MCRAACCYQTQACRSLLSVLLHHWLASVGDMLRAILHDMLHDTLYDTLCDMLCAE